MSEAVLGKLSVLKQRRRSVIVRMIESWELETVRILDDRDRLVEGMARAGELSRGGSGATYGWYWVVDDWPSSVRASQEVRERGRSWANTGRLLRLVEFHAPDIHINHSPSRCVNSVSHRSPHGALVHLPLQVHGLGKLVAQ